jgi:RNA polymerase sigma-70 factor (ECF subfamily)
MPSVDSSAGLLQPLLGRVCQGDAAALDELLRHSSARLTMLARHMLRGFPGVRRWADTDDVLQNSLIRLVAALGEVRPASPREFLGLATLQLRRELIDLARHYFGPQGQGTNHHTNGGDPENSLAVAAVDSTDNPASLAQWQEFHEQVGDLPATEREVVSLLYYQGLSQTEAAEVLGVSVRTVQRRWHAALEQLQRVWNGE